MADVNKHLIEKLRSKIRSYEDKKISGADISREIYWAAREIHAEDEGQVRRRLETLGNRIAVLYERGRTEAVQSEILSVIEELEGELREWGM